MKLLSVLLWSLIAALGATAFAVLALHFQNSGRHMKKGKFLDFAEALEALCDQIANEILADQIVPRHD